MCDKCPPMKMLTELREEVGGWAVYVDWQRVVSNESFAVADRVKYYLDHPEKWDSSEACEVATAIRTRYERIHS